MTSPIIAEHSPSELIYHFVILLTIIKCETLAATVYKVLQTYSTRAGKPSDNFFTGSRIPDLYFFIPMESSQGCYDWKYWKLDTLYALFPAMSSSIEWIRGFEPLFQEWDVIEVSHS